MPNNQTRSRFQSAPTPVRAIWPALLAIGATLILAWTGAWLFNLEEAGTFAACAALVVLALLAVGVRTAFGTRAPAAAAPADAHSRPAPVSRRNPATPFAKDSPNGETGGSWGSKRWSLDVFAAIDAQRFAAVCETWFSWAGFDTRTQAHRTDGGVDIWLHAARMPGPVAIVRCKHWLNQPVGLQEMKEFLGVVASFQSAHGTYTTTSTYTPEALQFARKHGIDAVDGRALLRRIQTGTQQRQQALLAVAYNGHG